MHSPGAWYPLKDSCEGCDPPQIDAYHAPEYWMPRIQGHVARSVRVVPHTSNHRSECHELAVASIDRLATAVRRGQIFGLTTMRKTIATISSPMPMPPSWTRLISAISSGGGPLAPGGGGEDVIWTMRSTRGCCTKNP